MKPLNGKNKISKDDNYVKINELLKYKKRIIKQN
jgi:hypothetical protein